jgi:polysaccharide pyruvyl transferase WcaK-like protein
MNIIILGASLNSNNLGVRALASGTIKAIKASYPNAKIYIFDYAYQPSNSKLFISGKNIDVKLINIRYSKKIYLSNNIAKLNILALLINIVRFNWFRNYIYRNNSYMRLISEANFIVSISGGDSFSDIYGVNRFLYVAFPQLLCILMKKNIFQIPQTFGPFTRSYVKYVARFILRQSKYVYSRDYQGVEIIKDLIKSQKKDQIIGFCYDFGFVLDPNPPDGLNIEGDLRDYNNLIGLNVSGLLYVGGYTRNNMFNLKIDYGKFIDSLIDYIIMEKKLKILLIPHVLGSSVNMESDWTVCEQIFNNLKNKYQGKLFFAKEIYNQNEIKYVIGRSKFFIGSRMHACIAALSQNIPTVAIAYSDKFIGVMKTIGMEELVADPRKLDESALLLKIGMELDNKDVYKSKLEVLMPHVKDNILKVFQQI